MDIKNFARKVKPPIGLPDNLLFIMLMSICFLLLSSSLLASLLKKNKPYAYLGEPPMHPAIGGADYDAALSLRNPLSNINVNIDDSRSEKLKRVKLLSMLKSLDKPTSLDFELKPYMDYKGQRHSASLSGITVIKGNVSSHFGFRRDPFNGRSRFHRGVDIAAKRGTKVFSPASGFVVFAGHKGGYGKVVEVQHDKSIMTRYAHLQKTLVSQGEVVHRGDVLGRTGNTGRSTGPHLHLEVLKKGRQVDPEIYFDGLLTGHGTH
jgi:murein DD-endopeptidase MepM/ murein hydrolase activator NlpD